MRTIFAVWHQAEGIITSHFFEAPPTPTQLHTLRVELERRHNRPDMVMQVREVALLGPTELPELHTRQAGPVEPSGSAAVDVFRVTGTGEVR